MALTDFQQDWSKIVDKGFANYNSLTKDERVWFNIQSLITQADNGGLLSHYYNSGANKNKETIEDLNFLGHNSIADILYQINNLFPGGCPSNDIEERNNVISSWPEEKYDDLLDKLDKEFYMNAENLELRLIEHIRKSGLSK